MDDIAVAIYAASWFIAAAIALAHDKIFLGIVWMFTYTAFTIVNLLAR